MPATCCPRPPSIKVAAAGPIALGGVVNGKPNAGVLFQTSCTVGLLWRVTPYSHSIAVLSALLTRPTARRSVLSMPLWPTVLPALLTAKLSYVHWIQPPMLSLTLPARNTLEADNCGESVLGTIALP